MRKAYALIPDIKKKIHQFLDKNNLESLTSLEKIFSDKTRHSYFSIVFDKLNKKHFFLKIRTHNLKEEKEAFKIQSQIGTFLKNNPSLSLNYYTPKLIKADTKPVDYLLYEYIKGKNMGSREINNYGAIRFKIDDINEIIKIVDALNSFPVDNQNFVLKKRDSKFFKNLVKPSKLLKIPKIYQLLKKNWYLFNKHAKFLSHGDFKPNNFIKSKNKLLIVDFETASISNPYTDIASLWAYAIRKPRWRKILLTKFISYFNLDNKSIFFLRLNLLIWSLYEHWLLELQDKKIQQQFKEIREKSIYQIINLLK